MLSFFCSSDVVRFSSLSIWSSLYSSLRNELSKDFLRTLSTILIVVFTCKAGCSLAENALCFFLVTSTLKSLFVTGPCKKRENVSKRMDNHFKSSPEAKWCPKKLRPVFLACVQPKKSFRITASTWVWDLARLSQSDKWLLIYGTGKAK